MTPVLFYCKSIGPFLCPALSLRAVRRLIVFKLLLIDGCKTIPKGTAVSSPPRTGNGKEIVMHKLSGLWIRNIALCWKKSRSICMCVCFFSVAVNYEFSRGSQWGQILFVICTYSRYLLQKSWAISHSTPVLFTLCSKILKFDSIIGSNVTEIAHVW